MTIILGVYMGYVVCDKRLLFHIEYVCHVKYQAQPILGERAGGRGRGETCRTGY